jgi:hypothetical protein
VSKVSRSARHPLALEEHEKPAIVDLPLTQIPADPKFRLDYKFENDIWINPEHMPYLPDGMPSWCSGCKATFPQSVGEIKLCYPGIAICKKCGRGTSYQRKPAFMETA